MEQTILDQIVDTLATTFGLESSTLVAVLVFLAAMANLATRLIPDDSIGWLATVRKATAVLGLYVPNRLSKHETSRDAERLALETAAYLPALRATAPIFEPENLNQEPIPHVVPSVVDEYLRAANAATPVEDPSDAR